MKKLKIVGFVILAAGGTFLLLNGIFSIMDLKEIENIKKGLEPRCSKPGSSCPLPDLLDHQINTIFSSIIVSTGIGIIIISKRYIKN